MSELIQVQEPVGGVRVITICRSRARNALNDQAIEELREAIRAFGQEEHPPCLVLEGEGDVAFCAGSDIKELANQSQSEKQRHTRAGQALTQEMARYTGATVAAIEGFCLGGGLELALACDLRIVGESSVLGLPEVSINSLPSWGGTVRLPHVVGLSRAKEMILFGRQLDGPGAVEWGLAAESVEDGRAGQTAVAMLSRLLEGTSGATLSRAKGLLAHWPPSSADAGLELEYLADCAQLASPEFAESFGSF